MADTNFLLLSHGAISHMNPTLRFAAAILRIGAKVTLLLSASAARRIPNDQLPAGLCLETFSDDGVKFTGIEQLLVEFERRGRRALHDLITSRAKEGRPFACLVNTLLIPWAAHVAAELHLPMAVLWIQSATIFDIFYYYFNGHGDLIRSNRDDESFSVQLPGLPLLQIRDLPSFVISDEHGFILKDFEEKLRILENQTDLPILVNTFDELEHDAIRVVEKFNFIPIGPLVSSFGIGAENEYMKWLDSKPSLSVVYIAFGSFSSLPRNQIDEIASGLLECGYEFLWVIRLDEMGERLTCMDELVARGKMVAWCSQMEVLSHRSVGCFVTHAGWNSTVETVAAGVPVVACPQWADQSTNAKMMEDVWKIGVRAKRNGEGLVEGKEIARCMRVLMDGGERGKEMRLNAEKWRLSAMEPARSSSELNLKAFVNKICQGK